ncbi:MAG: HNH endonuclease [Isosphaeraceae bacterium]
MRSCSGRAGDRCEYCGLSQAGQEAAFPVDHVVPRVAGGPTELDNLALACVSCSLRKWARRSAPAPETGEDTPLFSPRAQAWSDHFRWGGSGGRATDADGAGDGGSLGEESPVGSRHSNGRGRARPPSATMSHERRRDVAAVVGPPPVEPPTWPWSNDLLRSRLGSVQREANDIAWLLKFRSSLGGDVIDHW